MTEENQSINVVAKKQFSGCFTAFLLNNDIIEIIWEAGFIHIDTPQIIELKKAVMELGNGKKMRVYITTNALMEITPEARKLAASSEGEMFSLANAVLIDSLAKNLLFNFFLKINKPKTPIRGFTNREDAIAWLLNFD